MRIQRDSWLADRFGHDAFRVDADDPELLFAAVQRGSLPAHQAQTDRAFYYAKVPTTDLDTVRLMARLGFNVVDVNVTFARTPEAMPGRMEEIERSVSIVEAQPAHRDAVLHVAATAFVYSRFHLDPYVTDAVANDIKREWIANYFRGARGDVLFVALADGEPAGFLAANRATHNGEASAVIDLVGVSAAHQGQGIGRALTDRFVHHYAASAAVVRVGTQVANIPSMRLYERCGFLMEQTKYVMHLHLRGGKVLPDDWERP